MRIRQTLYRIKKRFTEMRTPKKSVDQSQKIAVVEGGKPEDYASVLSGYAVVGMLDEIRREDYPKIEIYMGAPPKDRLSDMTSLAWLQLSSAGLNGYDNDLLYHKKPMITTAKGIYGIPIAECVIGDILFLMKPALSNTINKKHAIPPLSGLEFTKSTILVCGLGDIGRNIAARCKGMGCSSVIGIDKYIPENENIDAVYELDQLHDKIPLADVIVSALPDLPETTGIFDEEAFCKMKKTAIFINVGRGNALKQDALIQAIKSNNLFGAALDVTTPDPLPRLNKLRRCSRVLITDHLACISRCNTERLQNFYLEQAKKYLRGEI